MTNSDLIARKLPNHTALKEWSTVIESLGRGGQVILIRKGGIADADFGIEAERFYLYPTYFHLGESEARPSVPITHWCEVVRTWTVGAAGSLDRLESEVVLPRETLESRYRFRPDQALQVIGVRTWALRDRATVVFKEAYAGCRSWISIDEEIDVTESLPVLDEAALRIKLESVGALLAGE